MIVLLLLMMVMLLAFLLVDLWGQDIGKSLHDSLRLGQFRALNWHSERSSRTTAR